jgi:hypothetical protein
MTEGEIQAAIRLAAGRAVPGCILWRNSTGVATHAPGTPGARTVRYGLAKGGSDLIGLLRVDSLFAAFLAVEVKTETGRLSPEQRMFGDLVIRCGGIFILARSVDDFVTQALAARERLLNTAIARARAGASE